MGVCCVNQGSSREQFTQTNPGYTVFQHYETSNLWAETTLKRLRSWGFTSVGGWSDYAALQQCHDQNAAFIPVLAVGMSCGVPWKDMWDTNIIAQMHQIARDQILVVRVIRPGSARSKRGSVDLEPDGVSVVQLLTSAVPRRGLLVSTTNCGFSVIWPYQM